MAQKGCPFWGEAQWAFMPTSKPQRDETHLQQRETQTRPCSTAKRVAAARAHSDLVVDRVEVPLDGARAEEELFSDLSVGETASHEPQHLYLP